MQRAFSDSPSSPSSSGGRRRRRSKVSPSPLSDESPSTPGHKSRFSASATGDGNRGGEDKAKLEALAEKAHPRNLARRRGKLTRSSSSVRSLYLVEKDIRSATDAAGNSAAAAARAQEAALVSAAAAMSKGSAMGRRRASMPNLRAAVSESPQDGSPGGRARAGRFGRARRRSSRAVVPVGGKEGEEAGGDDASGSSASTAKRRVRLGVTYGGRRAGKPPLKRWASSRDAPLPRKSSLKMMSAGGDGGDAGEKKRVRFAV